MKNENTGAPVRQRIVILDALRGFALLGIILANFPEFSLSGHSKVRMCSRQWTLQKPIHGCNGYSACS
jgi:uncharacterized membrane protein YeiB